MRILLAPIAAFVLIAAVEEAEVPAPETDNDEALIEELRDRVAKERERVLTERAFRRLQESATAKLLKERGGPLHSDCNDRLERVDESSETPELRIPDRLLRWEPDTPENPPLAIYAVDHRENGCGMMVMMGDSADVRPVPDLSAEDHRLMPAEQDAED